MAIEIVLVSKTVRMQKRLSELILHVCHHSNTDWSTLTKDPWLEFKFLLGLKQDTVLYRSLLFIRYTAITVIRVETSRA